MNAFIAVLALAATVCQASLPYGPTPYAPVSYVAAAAPYGTQYTPAAYAPAYGPAHTHGAGYAVPVAYKHAVVIPPSISSQYQSQDGYGNVAHGYSDINSAKYEQGNAYGGVTGGYSYVDANGVTQKVSYIADALGFRVKATNLPIDTGVAPVFNAEAPKAVEDTPEVVAAKAEFFKAFEAESKRYKRSAPYAAAPYAAAPYAAAPYAAAPYAAAPYVASPYAAAPYVAPPYVAAPYVAASYVPTPYTSAPYGAYPYAAYGHGYPNVGYPKGASFVSKTISSHPPTVVAVKAVPHSY